MASDLFSFWVPFDAVETVEKGGKTGVKKGRIHGIASTEVKDNEGEVVHQDGLDFTSAKWLTLEHPIGVINIIGKPVEFTPTSIKDAAATFMKGDLFLTDPLGKYVWDKAKAIKEAEPEDMSTRLGLSIEGRALAREPGHLWKCRVTSIAIAALPKNPLTVFDPVMNSLSRGLGGQIPVPGMFPDVMRAEVGYPAQGVPSAGAIAPAVPQSMQGVGWRRSLLKDLDNEELLAARFLRNLPWLTWAQGMAAVKKIRQKIREGRK